MAGKQESKYKENEANFDHHINEEQKQELMGLTMTFVEKAVSRLTENSNNPKGIAPLHHTYEALFMIWKPGLSDFICRSVLYVTDARIITNQ